MQNIQTVQLRPQWQQELAQAVSDPYQLAELLSLPKAWADEHASARQLFPLRVPRYFVGLMQQGNERDPLLMQVMPNAAEYLEHPEFVTDPLQEQQGEHNGVLHKYRSRVLVILRGGCAVNCRYCFRRHFPYQDHHFGRQQLEQLVTIIGADSAINEVILSGGDPLMATDSQISRIIDRLEAIPQLKRIRIHTRLPVVLPSRLTEELAQRLAQSRLKAILVLHTNHANEVSVSLKKALATYQNLGITLLNQSVLLKGINDTAAQLVDLSEALFDAGVMPYYLHQLDKVAGASHFDVSDERARALHLQIRARLPGFLVPQLVREIAGEPNKTPL